MTDQGFGAGRSASEGFKHLWWGATAAQAEHGVGEAGSGFANLILLIQTHLFKSGEGISTENLSPFVGVKPSGVAPAKMWLKV